MKNDGENGDNSHNANTCDESDINNNIKGNTANSYETTVAVTRRDNAEFPVSGRAAKYSILEDASCRRD